MKKALFYLISLPAFGSDPGIERELSAAARGYFDALGSALQFVFIAVALFIAYEVVCFVLRTLRRR